MPQWKVAEFERYGIKCNLYSPPLSHAEGGVKRHSEGCNGCRKDINICLYDIFFFNLRYTNKREQNTVYAVGKKEDLRTFYEVNELHACMMRK